MTQPPVERADDADLIAGLRAGDERAFAELIDRYGTSLLRMAIAYVGSRAVAEEVVQETLLGVVTSIGRFEGRASLKTWLFRILHNTAITRGSREARSVPFSALTSDEDEGPTVDPSRFMTPDGRWAGHWTSPPQAWAPEERLLAGETRTVVARAIEQLPESQRTVITLRDVEGWSAQEVRDLLELSEANQRVLLHRARARVRRALEEYLTSA